MNELKRGTELSCSDLVLKKINTELSSVGQKNNNIKFNPHFSIQSVVLL